MRFGGIFLLLTVYEPSGTWFLFSLCPLGRLLEIWWDFPSLDCIWTLQYMIPPLPLSLLLTLVGTTSSFFCKFPPLVDVFSRFHQSCGITGVEIACPSGLRRLGKLPDLRISCSLVLVGASQC